MIELSNKQKNDILLKYYFNNSVRNSFTNNLNSNLYESPSPTDSDDEYEDDSDEYDIEYDDDEYEDNENLNTSHNYINENPTFVASDNVYSKSEFEEKYNDLIDELNIIEYIEKDADFENSQCIICYDNDKSQRGLKCINSHIFHEKCIYNWIKESKKYDCPLCTNEMILSKIYI